MSEEIEKREAVGRAEAAKQDSYPSYEGIYELKDTVKLMLSTDYKERFVGEYVQLKIRYEKLKAMLTKWDAYSERFESSFQKEPTECMTDFVEWMGFLPSCSRDILRQQQTEMGILLNILEVRACIEGIDLRLVTIKL